jgi:hypothetical protein
MSLSALRTLRVNHAKPEGVVKVVVGKRLKSVDSRPDVITVRTAPELRGMDLRPVIGLPVVLFVCDGFTPLAEQAFDALIAAGAQPIGAVWRDVAVTSHEPSKPALRRAWESLCL